MASNPPTWFRACKDGDTAAVAAHLALLNVDPNGIDAQGFTGFQLACFRGRAGVVEKLLADPRVLGDAVGPGGYTGWHFSCREGKMDCVEILLKFEDRVDVNKAKKGGLTGFMLAAREG
jgi:ankyrin repeat protein